MSEGRAIRIEYEGAVRRLRQQRVGPESDEQPLFVGAAGIGTDAPPNPVGDRLEQRQRNRARPAQVAQRLDLPRPQRQFPPLDRRPLRARIRT